MILRSRAMNWSTALVCRFPDKSQTSVNSSFRLMTRSLCSAKYLRSFSSLGVILTAWPDTVASWVSKLTLTLPKSTSMIAFRVFGGCEFTGLLRPACSRFLIRLSSSSNSNGLLMYWLAPTSNPRVRSSASVLADSIKTGVVIPVSRIVSQTV